MQSDTSEGPGRSLPSAAIRPLEATERPSASPLTERILERLGRPRWLWIAAWALVPLVSPIAISVAVTLTRPPLRESEVVDLGATQIALAWACLIFLWGGAMLGRQASSLRQDLPRLMPRAETTTELFTSVGRVRGPLLLTAAIGALVSANTVMAFGPLAALVAVVPLLLYLLPIATFIWVDVVILVGLNRLGRIPLTLEGFPQDRTLGLERLGALASTALGLLLIAALPILVAGSDEPVTLAISLAVVVLIVASFVVAMWGLHRQMVGAKREYVSIARGLYADAYAPLRERPTIEVLETQSSLLGAAKALEERATGLMTWPVDEGTLRFIIVIVSGVVTGLVVRAVFAAVGF